MNLKEYEKAAIRTRVYSPKVALPYLALGLNGEVGEFFEKFSKEEINIDLLLKEIGDVLWYTASLCVELNIDLGDDFPPVSSVNKQTPYNIVMSAGSVAEQMKKYLRDDWKENEEVAFPKKRKEIIKKALWTLLSEFQSLSLHFNSTLEVIAMDNIEKLSIREKNNCIHGSGDAAIR